MNHHCQGSGYHLIRKEVSPVVVNQEIARFLNGKSRDGAVVQLNLIRKHVLIGLIQVEAKNSPENAGEKTAVRDYPDPIRCVAVPGKQ